MRFAVFLLGLLGSFIAGFGGLLLLGMAYDREVHREALGTGLDPGLLLIDPFAFETVKAAVFLAVGSVLGMLGCLFVLIRRGPQGGLLMLLASLGPALFNPMTTVFSGLLVLAGLLSFFVRPLPYAAAEPPGVLAAE